MSTDLYVVCDCSARIDVTPAKCGCTVHCRCGKPVQVPALGELRANAGLPALKSNPIQQIDWLRTNSQLPMESKCVACGCSTDAFLAVSVQYEVKFGRLLDLLPKPLLFLFAPIWFVPLMRRSMELKDAADEDRFVEIWVRLCTGCLNDLPRNKQTIKTIAGKTELYADLFRAYPRAVIRSVEPLSPTVSQAAKQLGTTVLH